MICSVAFGCFPWEFYFPDNKSRRRAYEIYGRIMFAYYIVFIFTIFVQLVVMLKRPDFDIDAVCANMCVTLINTVTLFRQLVFHFNPKFKKIIQKVIDMESQVYRKGDEKICSIYTKYVKGINKSLKLYFCFIGSLLVIFCVRPLLADPVEQRVGDEVKLVRPLPQSSWFPIDTEEQYLYVYTWGCINCMISAFFVTCSDLIMFALLTQPMGHLNILHEILQNFDEHKRNFALRNQIVNDDIAAYWTLVDVIKHHNEIITYVNEINDCMSFVMLCDFLQSSLQVACILTQALENDIDVFLVLFMISFIGSMFLRLILYYHYGNELLTTSQNIALSAWQSNWYDQSPQVKIMMFTVIARAQKPLKFYLGQFGVMSLQAFISVLRASYSYMTLMYGLN
ncbi:hypothetical protein D910_09314 [Dendroctonus ponderosae]|uniref:Odorant receptor n=2 Tax=Dendroctonus ponderosae TaxID=77166 RepID=J3JWQ7_DENPD|nr:unknown [Dendroctonus ponderosae]ERL91992.1 hypothetical protein D910_09314 [Dendroctonus ponderosae]KAH1026866.1 hypothetical protein HUJ05_000476 [Dendroctonus ponderosae]